MMFLYLNFKSFKKKISSTGEEKQTLTSREPGEKVHGEGEEKQKQ